MTYVPQVHLSCNRCLHELEMGTRVIGSVLQVTERNLLEAHECAYQHYSADTRHFAFYVILRSTGEIMTLDFRPFYGEGKTPPCPEKRF